MTPPSAQTIGIIGAGAWGTALAVTLTRQGRFVRLWGRNHKDLMDMAARGTSRHLPDVRLNPLPHVTRELAEAARCDVVLLVVPMQELRSLAPLLALNIRPKQVVINCAKGIEVGTGKLPSEVLVEFMPQATLAMLSGPTFAREVALGLPAAVAVACADAVPAQHLATLLSGPAFRCYPSADLLGVELCGAVKNVLAIAAGIAMGRGLGENARAAIITRGLAELARLLEAQGAPASTLHGLAGIGDVLLSCTSAQSRNYSLGLRLGESDSLTSSEESGKLAEGRFTASAVLHRAEPLGVELPICQTVDSILNQQADITQAIAALLARPLRI